MRVPTRVRPDWPRVPDDIDIRIPLHSSLEVPPILVKLVTHQVEQAIWKVSNRQQFGWQARRLALRAPARGVNVAMATSADTMSSGRIRIFLN